MKQVQKISVAYHPDTPPPASVIEKWKNAGIEVLVSLADTRYQLAGGTGFFHFDTHREVTAKVAELVRKDLEPYNELIGGLHDHTRHTDSKDAEE